MRHLRRRLVEPGGEYTLGERVELEDVEPREEIPVDIQGESWGWTKGPPYPLDYDGKRPE